MPTVVIPSGELQLGGHAPAFVTTDGSRTLLRVNPSTIERGNFINISCKAGEFIGNPNTKAFINGVELIKVAQTEEALVCELPPGMSLMKDVPLVLRDYGWNPAEKPYFAETAVLDPAWTAGVDHAWLYDKDLKTGQLSELVGGATYTNDYVETDGVEQSDATGQHIKMNGSSWHMQTAGGTFLIEWMSLNTSDLAGFFDPDRSQSYRGMWVDVFTTGYFCWFGAGFTATTTSNYRRHNFTHENIAAANPGYTFGNLQWYKVAIGIDDIGTGGSPASRISINGGNVVASSAFEGTATSYNRGNGGQAMVGGRRSYYGYDYANIRIRMVAVLNHKTATDAELQDLSANPYQIFTIG